MSDLSDREKGFERKFAFDEETRFKANCPAEQAAWPVGC